MLPTHLTATSSVMVFGFVSYIQLQIATIDLLNSTFFIHSYIAMAS